MDIKDFSPNVRVYKDDKLIFQIWPDKSNHNYIAMKVHSDEALAHVIKKYVVMPENGDTNHEIIYARVRGSDYDQFKKDGSV